jgi:hypothetical protein
VWDSKERLGEDGETTLLGARSARRRAGEQRVCVVLFQSGTQRQGIKKQAKDEKDSVNKGCVTLWPCHLH